MIARKRKKEYYCTPTLRLLRQDFQANRLNQLINNDFYLFHASPEKSSNRTEDSRKETNAEATGILAGNLLHMEHTEVNNEQRLKIVEEKLKDLNVSINVWAKNNELDHRIVEDLIQGNLRGTHGTALNTRKKMEAFFGQIFGP